MRLPPASVGEAHRWRVDLAGACSTDGSVGEAHTDRREIRSLVPSVAVGGLELDRKGAARRRGRRGLRFVSPLPVGIQ